MWFSLFATVLVLAITFYEGLQGLFTALINCILAILAAALAFGIYEDIYFGVLREYQPDHGRAIAMMAVFVLALLILRTLFDMLVKNNVQFPLYVDRAGGGLFGFFTGMVIVGMLSIGFELLPFGDTFLAYPRFSLVDKASNKAVPFEELTDKDFTQLQYRRNGAWLRQDDFTVALVSHLSKNALHSAGRNSLDEIYPNFLDQNYFYQARLLKEAMPTADPKIELKVEGFSDVRQTDFFSAQREEREGKKVTKLAPCKDQPGPRCKRIAVRTAFTGAGQINFTARQIRLLAKDKKTGDVSEYLLAGIGEEKGGNKLVQTADGEIMARDTGGKNNCLELVFEVPESLQFDEGSFIEFKQNARAEILASMAVAKKATTGSGARNQNQAAQDSSEQPDANSGHKRPPGPSNSTSNQDHDRISGLGPARGAEVTDMLPFSLTEYGGQIEAGNGVIRSGRMFAALTEDWQPVAGNKSPIDRIEAPEGMRLIQVSVEKLQAASTLGQAKAFAVDKLADYYLIDSAGGKHMPVGMYGIARAGGKPTFELVLLDEAARSGEEVMGKLPAFEKIRRQEFAGEYALYFIFQVKPGTRASKIHTGGANIDLEELNIEAK